MVDPHVVARPSLPPRLAALFSADGEPDAVEPDAVEPDAVEPDAVEPDAVEPDAVEPDAVEPDRAESSLVEPRLVEPRVVARPSLPPRLAALLAEPTLPAAPAVIENPVIGNPVIENLVVEPAVAERPVGLPSAASPAGITQDAARVPLLVPERVPDCPTLSAGLAALPAVDEPAPEPAVAQPEISVVDQPQVHRPVPWSAATEQPPPVSPLMAPAASTDEAAGEWVAYTPPPIVRASRQPATWDTPPGFVPLQPPRGRSSALNYVAIGVVVATVAALGWFGYQAFFRSTPKGAVGAAPAAAVTYTSPDGHFTVGLPAQPVTSTYVQSYGAYHLQASMASVPGAREVAAGLVVTPSIPAEHMSEFMAGAVSGFARNSHLANVTSTNYEGHPAITATGTTTDGATVQMLFYAYSSTRMYMLMAPDGASMTALEGQFRPTA